MIKPGSNDIKVFLKFTEAELEILQDNAYQMAESFGLDRRITYLTGKRKVGFYMWDLECLEAVIGSLKKEDNADLNIANGLYVKIKQAMDFLDKAYDDLENKRIKR
jgi:hypothetical protein